MEIVLIAIIVSVALTIRSSPAAGQMARATITDSSVVIASTYERLFKDISMSPAQQMRARSIIRDTFIRTLKVSPNQADQWQQLKPLVTRRDSVLRAILLSRLDRETFDRHLSRERVGWR
jgi:hypothetical protein